MSVSKELSLVKEEKFVRYWDTICMFGMTTLSVIILELLV